MVSRERLRLVAEHGARLASERRVRIAGQLLLAAGLVFVALRIRSIWHDSHISLRHVSWLPLLGSGALAIAATITSALIWLAILRRLGVATRVRWVGIFLQAQLAKYIPGTVWQYAGRTALARTQGLALRPVALSLPIEFAGAAFGAVVLSASLLGWWGALAIPIAAVAAMLIAKFGPGFVRNTPSQVALFVAPLYLGAWPLTGLGFWLIGRALLDIPANDIPKYAGAFAAAWLVGVVAIFAPGGIGVREAVLVAILRNRIGSADAVVLAAASRAMLALVDVVMAGTGAFLTRRRPRTNHMRPMATE